MSLRLPEDLRDQLKRAGKRNRRSMSAELIFRVQESFQREPREMADFAKRVMRLLEKTGGHK
jgi:hypothetical protein